LLKVNLIIIADCFGVTKEEICNQNRNKEVFFCRLIIAENLFQVTNQSTIGRLLNKKRMYIRYYLNEYQNAYKTDDHFRKMCHQHKNYFQ
jgi:hypothetical protein